MNKTTRRNVALNTLRCANGCGATFEAPCDCGVGYLPAGEVALRAVAAFPEKSNVMLAEEIGVSVSTVRRSREQSGCSNEQPAKRKGRDGKKYPARVPRPALVEPEQPTSCPLPSPFEQVDAWVDTMKSLVDVYKEYEGGANDVVNGLSKAIENGVYRLPLILRRLKELSRIVNKLEKALKEGK